MCRCVPLPGMFTSDAVEPATSADEGATVENAGSVAEGAESSASHTKE